MVVSILGPAQTLKPFSRIVIARRADGVTVKLRSAIPGDLTLLERTLSFTDGNEITLFDSLKVKSTWPLKNPDEVRDFIQNLAPHKDCNVSVSSTHLGYTSLFGQPVSIVQHTIPGRYRVTQWLSPELGCEQLNYESEAINADGSFTLTAKGTLSKFTPGEPDPQLFDPGLTYSEVKPSDAHDRLLRKVHLALNAQEQLAVRREGSQMDRRYHSGDLGKPRWGGVIAAQ